jgi:hypothetical protein
MNGPYQIQLLKPGSERTLLSASTGNDLIRALNALLKAKVQRGSTDAFFISDSNAVIQIARNPEAGTGGGGSSVGVYKVTSITNIASDYVKAKPVTYDASNAETLGTEVNVALPWQLRAGRYGTVFPAYAVDDYIIVASSEDGVGVVVSSVQLTLVDLGIGRQMQGTYRGAWSSGTKYGEGDFVHTITGNSLVTLLWAAVQPSTAQTPSVSSTTYWRLVGVYGDVRKFTINSGQTNNDYLVCDLAAGGTTNVSIYKPYELRGSTTSETIAGTTWSYTSYGSDYQSRTASDGTITEKQVVIPYWLTGKEIFAFYDLVAERWEDMNRGGHAWARKFDQS